MRICVAQTFPEKGKIDQNIENHRRIIEESAAQEVDLIVFPELSLTGYEPSLAHELAMSIYDKRLDIFQQLSNSNKIVIGVGAPLKNDGKIHISMIIFQPYTERIIYTKQYLYQSEEDYFSPAINEVSIRFQKHKISFAICYELSVPQHSLAAYLNDTNIYIASVLNSVNGVDNDIERLSNIAKQYKMTVLMSNFVGKSGGYDCAGKSSIWNNRGDLIGQLDNKTEGILGIDTETRNVFYKVLMLDKKSYR